MTERSDLDAFIYGSAGILGLAIDPDWLTGIRSNLAVSLDMARLVETFPLDDETEPGPVYRIDG